MKPIINFLKLILIASITILSKVFLQIVLGTILNLKLMPYDALKLYNGTGMIFSDILYFLFIEFIYYFVLYYLWLYIILYFIVLKLRNKISIQLFYWLLMYNFAVLFFNDEIVNFYSIIVVLILGTLNWWMFKKWIK